VYDLTTASHHFGAGVGMLVVHNTDSVFVECPGRTVSQSAVLGNILAHDTTEIFRRRSTGDVGQRVMELEFEKTICPAIFREEKKNYIGVVWEPNKKGTMIKQTKLLAKGNEIARRDHMQYVRSCLERALRALMFECCRSEDADQVSARTMADSLPKCYDAVKKDVQRLVENLVPREEFCLSKTLKRQDAYASMYLPHCQVALRMTEWPTGARVQYFLRQPTLQELHSKKMDELKAGGTLKMSELAEDPETATRRGAVPWRHKALSAFRSGLKRPLDGGWSPGETAHIFDIFERASKTMENELKRQRTMDSYNFLVAPSGAPSDPGSADPLAPLPSLAPLAPLAPRPGRGRGRGKRPR
jgi:hypothetical protein